MGVASTGAAAQGAFLTELFPVSIRYSGVALSRELTGAILGGSGPLIATPLYAATDHWWPIAIFMITNAVITLVAVRLSKYFRSDADQGTAITDLDPSQLVGATQPPAR